MGRFAALSLAALLAACHLGPDPVIRDDVDLGPLQSVEAERFGMGAGLAVLSRAGASDSRELAMYSTTSTHLQIKLLLPVSAVLVRARGESCDGPPKLALAVDGRTSEPVEVESARFSDYAFVVSLDRGMHDLGLSFTNDYFEKNRCDRNLFIDKLIFLNADSAARFDLPVRAMTASSGVILDDRGGRLLGSSTLTGQARLEHPIDRFALRAQRGACHRAEVNVKVDGASVATIQVEPQWKDHPIEKPLAGGIHVFTLTPDQPDCVGIESLVFGAGPAR